MSQVEEVVQHNARFAADGEALAGGEFEVCLITAGEGNGWQFGESALRESVGLWDGAECFIDHGHMSVNRSVRDLAGVFSGAVWDAARRGVVARLSALGPGAGLLLELSKQVLKEGPRPRVGFSADVFFSAQGRVVQKILRVNSVDLVFNPARGGAFLRALNSVMPEEKMSETNQTVEQLQADLEAMRTFADVQAEKDKLQAEAEAARALRAQMCGYVLESALAGSKLPGPMVEQVRKQFNGKVFEVTELDAAIRDARELVGKLSAGGLVQGPGRVSAMFSSEDRLRAAVDDLMGAPRDAGMEGVKVERLSGIRELYLMLTGDDDLHGGYNPERVRLATTADFTGLVKNAMNKIVTDRWAELGRAGYNWWEKIVTVEHALTLNDLTGIVVGTVGSLPTIAEGAEYTELPIGDNPETASFTKYGGYIPLTIELIDRDETRKLREYPRQLAAAALRNISSLIAGIFTTASGTGPLMADTGRLFNATAVTTAAGHKNLLTTALSASEWDVVSTAVFNQPMLTKQAAPYIGVGPKMGINPRYLLVPRALQLTAMKVLYPTLENAANIYSENQQRGQPGDVLVVPEWTDANDWAAVCDPKVAPAIYIGERFGLRPEIYIAGNELNAAVFMNDEHRMKVRHFLAVMVADYRPLHKSNV